VTFINQPSKNKIEDLLAGTGNRIEIPSFQRSYSWTVDEARDLYTDIIRFQERYPGNKIDDAEYFIGAIVGVRQGKVLRLLDGQQRIATITILLSSIRDKLRPVTSEDADDEIQKLNREDADDIQKTLIQERPKPGKKSVTQPTYVERVRPVFL
jgi:uncharacterized protein with ParB-like and HNH nuclease domain